MLLSTFELLVKRQLPRSIVDSAGNEIILPTSPLSRGIVQGYFLTLANTSDRDVSVRLTFDAVSTVIDLPDLTATFLDRNGLNEIGDAVPDSLTSYQYPIELAAKTTALFILQPDILKPDALRQLNIEVRGYVDIALDSPNDGDSIQLMITPEHRGTFFRPGITDATPRSERQLGEIAYALPTASGGSLFEF